MCTSPASRPCSSRDSDPLSVLYDCLQLFLDLKRSQPPTTKVYQASSAAAQRIGMSLEDLGDLVMKEPDTQIMLEASIAVAKVRGSSWT